ncbi:glycosyltransferase family 2 protein [Staphylococcus edaphicus]|uniref:Glycosyl transferase n=1 Tax=Staphylococcus edaphicus TaxID=1955013 RepID=A0A2C6VKC2_9STAP|nr:glycosyltransferase family 2 protein [Staphylococcus edaphicus]PHK50641.1 glycosyl transferase [Staphylococcus edaphicus]UQW80687.1 glycosyltransferase family 2 protein [Staphylococcus edaphicus]
MKKLLSIIVPVYNKALFLEDCIESINQLNMNKENIEAIFVDDCSSDQSLEILEKFVAKYHFIKLIKLTENTGSPSEPRNVGIKQAQGDYITFLDADDWLDAEGLPMLLNQAATHQSDVAFGHSVKHTEKIIKKLGRFSSYKVANNLVPYEIDRIFRAVGPPGKIIKREIILKNNITFKHMKYGEDKLFFIEAISKCQTASMNPAPAYHVNRYSYNQSLVGQTSIIEKTQLNLLVLEEVLKLDIPEYAEYQAISRIVEMDFMSRLFSNKRFLTAENKTAFYELFNQMERTLEKYGKNLESYLLNDKFRNIYHFLKNGAYQQLCDFIEIIIQGQNAKRYVKDNQLYFLLPENLTEALPIKEPLFAVYEGTQLIDQQMKDVIRIYKDEQRVINKVELTEINNEINAKNVKFEEHHHYIYIDTHELNQCDFDFNISIIYDDYNFVNINTTLPNASNLVKLKRQNFKAEFLSTLKPRQKQKQNVVDTSKYLTYNPEAVSLVKQAKLYNDIEFKQPANVEIEIGELIDIHALVYTDKGTPRLQTVNGYYLTANKQFVQEVNRFKIAQYINKRPEAITILKKCKEYQNRKFEGTALNIMTMGERVDIKKIVLSPKGTPRLKTFNDTFITANRDFVKISK